MRISPKTLLCSHCWILELLFLLTFSVLASAGVVSFLATFPPKGIKPEAVRSGHVPQEGGRIIFYLNFPTREISKCPWEGN